MNTTTPDFDFVTYAEYKDITDTSYDVLFSVDTNAVVDLLIGCGAVWAEARMASWGRVYFVARDAFGGLCSDANGLSDLCLRLQQQRAAWEYYVEIGEIGGAL